jgi:abortive infection bacteriophage resistance protein
MKYERPHLTIAEQADTLISRGMHGDRAMMIEKLRSVSYFRLKGYTFPFRMRDVTRSDVRLDTFQPGTRFEDIWAQYIFDRRLRLLMMDAIERIEIAARSGLAEAQGVRFGVFGYAKNPDALPYAGQQNARHDLLSRHRAEQDRSKDKFSEHFRDRFGDSERDMPIWMATEVWSLGTLIAFFKASPKEVRTEVSKTFGVDESVLATWLLSLNTVRNICAHHGRLWNREPGTIPMIPDKIPDWNVPERVPSIRIFPILTICLWSLSRIAPQSTWAARCSQLVHQISPNQLVSMGFPERWKQCPIWARVAKTS